MAKVGTLRARNVVDRLRNIGVIDSRRLADRIGLLAKMAQTLGDRRGRQLADEFDDRPAAKVCQIARRGLKIVGELLIECVALF